MSARIAERPVVLVVSRHTTRKNRLIDYVGEAHLELLVRLRMLPVIVPVVDGTLACLAQYMQGMSGLLLVEGEDVEPTRYRARPEAQAYLDVTHALKDQIELRLLRHALRQRIAVLGICRGSQLLNVVGGGTLFGDVQKEKQSNLKHIENGLGIRRYDSYRHPIALVADTPLHRWYGQTTIEVNSYHHQGVRELGRRFKPMAHAPDGLVEAFYDPTRDFTVGLQFHPERMLQDHSGNLRVWKEFGAAVHRVHSRKS